MRLQEIEGNIQEKYNLLMSNATCYDNIFNEYFMKMLQKDWRTYVQNGRIIYQGGFHMGTGALSWDMRQSGQMEVKNKHVQSET